MGAAKAYSGPSSAPIVAKIPPNRCPSTVPSNMERCSRTSGLRGSYCSIFSLRWYLLETIEERVHGGEVVSVFARSFVVLGARAGCTDSRMHRKHRAVVCSNCLEFLFWASIPTGYHRDIYRDIPTWVPRLPMLRFGGRRECRRV